MTHHDEHPDREPRRQHTSNWPRRIRIARNIIALVLTLTGGFAAGDTIGDIDEPDTCEDTEYDD